MTNDILSTLEINQLTKSQYEAAKAAGKLNENALYMTPAESLIERLTGVISSDSSYWSGNIYQKLNTDYAHGSYDIDIDLAGTSTDAEESAWFNARFYGSSDSNLLTAKGVKPAIDIPIIITLIKK